MTETLTVHPQILNYYNYNVICNYCFEEPEPVIQNAYTYEENGVYYCASATQKGVYWYIYARNCPLMYTDPDGEIVWFAPLIAIAVSAAVSAASYTIQVACSPGGFQNWNTMNFFASTFMGAWSGAATAGIGGVIGGVSMTTGMGVLKELGRAGAHATVSGLTSMAGGGKFWQGAATGAISSFTGSLTHNLPIAAQIGVSTLTGGVTSKISGGTFWQGAVTGFTISAFNHAMDALQDKILQKQLEAKLKTLQVGKSISGKELGQVLGNDQISLAISKITRIDETTFEVTRTLVGTAFLNDSPMKIQETELMINGKNESMYRVQIDYKNFSIKKGALPDFYINNNNILFYKDGKLYYGDTK